MSDKITSAQLQAWIKAKDEKAVLATLADAKDAKELEQLLNVLGTLKSASASIPVARLTSHPDRMVQEAAVKALAKIDDAQARTFLLQAAQQLTKIPQYLAIDALAKIPSEAAKEILRTLVVHPDGYARKRAARALLKSGESHWSEMIQGTEEDFLRLAVQGEEAAIQKVLDQLTSDRPETRKAAVHAVLAIARAHPQLLHNRWNWIQQTLQAPHTDTHDDQVEKKSSDCDYHEDTHQDVGLGVDFPDDSTKDF